MISKHQIDLPYQKGMSRNKCMYVLVTGCYIHPFVQHWAPRIFLTSGSCELVFVLAISRPFCEGNIALCACKILQTCQHVPAQSQANITWIQSLAFVMRTTCTNLFSAPLAFFKALEIIQLRGLRRAGVQDKAKKCNTNHAISFV